MAIKVPVYSFQRDLWIVAFIPVLVYFLTWLCAGALEELSKGRNGNPITTSTGNTRNNAVEAITPPSGALFEPAMAITTTSVTTTGPMPRQGKYRKAFGVEAFNEASHVLLIGFILLVSMAAISNALGYASRSLMALSKFSVWISDNHPSYYASF